MSGVSGVLVLVGRILFSSLFAMAGINHVKRQEMMLGYAASARFPQPYLAGWPAGIWLLAGAVSLALGVWPDIGVLMIGLFVVLAASYFHRFWEIQDQAQRQMQMQLFFRNVIALGASLALFGFFAAAGEGLRFTITEPLFNF